jgi:DNA primase
MNSETGLWICYSCGAKGTLPQLIMELTGKEDFAVTEMIMNNNVQRLQMPEWERRPEVDHQMYLHYPEVPKNRLDSRNITAEVARKHGLRWNDKNNSWIIPMVSSDGDLMGWQEKQEGTRVFKNSPAGVKKSKTLFGGHEQNPDMVVVVESPLDAVRISSAGIIGAVSTFGAIVSDAQVKLLRYSDIVIAAFDNPNIDEAGRNACAAMVVSARKYGMTLKFFNYGSTGIKDVGDMTDDQVKFGIETAKDSIYGESAYLS